MENVVKNIVDLDLIERFPSQYPNKSFSNYVSNLVGLEGFIAVAGVLAPSLTKKSGGIFVSENLLMLKGNMSTRFGDDLKTLERYVNLFCISDFYLMAADEASQDEFLILEFANIVKQFWGMHLHRMFPNNSFEIEISQNGLFDEDGICLTFSQKRNT